MIPPLAAFNEKEQTGKHQQSDAVYLYSRCLLQDLYHHLRQDFNHILIHPIFIIVKHNASQDSQLMMSIVLYI